MRKVLLLLSAVLLASVPNMASAVLVDALDFTGGGSAWTVISFDTGLPLDWELDGDPTNVGIDNNTTASGHYRMYQEVFAPAGFTMSNVVVTAKTSGYSSWVMDGRIGLFTTEGYPLTNDYWGHGADPGGVVNVDLPKTLDASGDPTYTGVSSVMINVEIVKLLTVWTANNVREIEVFADLTAIVPEPASLGMLAMGGMMVLLRRRRIA